MKTGSLVAGGCAYWLALSIRIGDSEIEAADEMFIL